MPTGGTQRRAAIVTGATGQDGYYLVTRLLEEGWIVWAAVRDVELAETMFSHHERLRAVRRDLRDPGPLCALIADVRPEEMYNLAGESSVARSFDDPRATWETNAHVVVRLLDAIRHDSPETRFYQASSGEMFGATSGGDVVHNEDSRLNPQSPYAAAKSAAHLLCSSYRESYDLRIGCGILFNHESRRRGGGFLSRKVVSHVHETMRTGVRHALRVGNLKAQRDWGFAPDYVEGMIRIARQTALRNIEDTASSYCDYVLGTGELHAVWELIDRAFAIAGHELTWKLNGDDWSAWKATFADTDEDAVVVDPSFVRPSDPNVIGADPERIRRDLDWSPRPGLDLFLTDMLEGVKEPATA